MDFARPASRVLPRAWAPAPQHMEAPLRNTSSASLDPVPMACQRIRPTFATVMDYDDVVKELHRSAVRVVLVDAAGHVLLLHVTEPAHPEQGDCWELPGGGIDSGEDVLAAAHRELLEETGLSVPIMDITPPRWFRSVAFLHAGVRRVQIESIALAVVRQLSPAVQATAFSSDETEIYLGYRWWTVGEIETSDARFFPTCLPRVLPAFLSGDRIEEPFDRFS
jgi:8-oxo-dGTP pyrophosphatase MutT (NUDIX family)